jgi:hypothetical protein
MNLTPALDVDTAMVLGMASTALPFADSRETEAERWLRILRMYGDAGEALQSLGVSESPLEDGSEGAPGQPPAADGDEDIISVVTERAVAVAIERSAPLVTPGDVLIAVMDTYGEDFENVLHAHGTDRAEVTLRLGIGLEPVLGLSAGFSMWRHTSRVS